MQCWPYNVAYHSGLDSLVLLLLTYKGCERRSHLLRGRFFCRPSSRTFLTMEITIVFTQSHLSYSPACRRRAAQCAALDRSSRELGEDPERYAALKQELATAYGPGDALWDRQILQGGIGQCRPEGQRDSDRKSKRGKHRRNTEIAGTKPECYRKQRTGGGGRGHGMRGGTGVPPVHTAGTAVPRRDAKLLQPLSIAPTRGAGVLPKVAEASRHFCAR